MTLVARAVSIRASLNDIVAAVGSCQAALQGADEKGRVLVVGRVRRARAAPCIFRSRTKLAAAFLQA
eukprot:3653522-Heterocapsa_arctica.AAC.1